MAYAFLTILFGLGNPPPNQQAALAGAFGVAFLFGFIVGYIMYKAAYAVGHFFAASMFDYRKERLLLECWDAMHGRPDDDDATRRAWDRSM